MTITAPTYASRENLRRVLDIKTTARNLAELDRALEAGTEAVDALTRRSFYPYTDTRYFDWPHVQYPLPWRLWLGRNELISCTSIASGGTTILYSSGTILLYSVTGKAPYNRLELDRGSNAAFAGATTPQRGVAVTGVFGSSDGRERSGGTVAEALDLTETEVQLATSESVAPGDLIRVDSERMLVTDRDWLDTGQTVQSPGLSNGATGVTLVVTTGSAYNPGEVLLIDSERMLIEDRAGNNLTVRRAYDGSVLAAHTAGATIFAQRSYTVVRGSAGTTAATHSISAPVAVHAPQALIRSLCLGEATNFLLSETTGWARVIGASEYVKEMTGKGLDALRKQAKMAYGRQSRAAAV